MSEEWSLRECVRCGHSERMHGPGQIIIFASKDVVVLPTMCHYRLEEGIVIGMCGCDRFEPKLELEEPK